MSPSDKQNRDDGLSDRSPGFSGTFLTEADSESREPEKTQITSGTKFGRYIVIQQIGSGGMGLVCSAYDPELDRKVALKLVRTEGDRELQARLLREAKAVAKVSHPNVIMVHDVGTLNEQVFIAMEFVGGQNLSQWIREKPRSWREVLEVYLQAGQGLAAAHAVGLVHRDFKPENVLLSADNRVRVIDFGLAAPLAASPDMVNESTTDGKIQPKKAEVGLTKAGTILGTPQYMSPEQHSGQAADARSDQYNFCVALYVGLYQKAPFQGFTPEQLLSDKQANVVEETPADSSVPRWLRRIVLKGLSPKREDRWPSMEELLKRLGKNPSIRRQRMVAAGALLTFCVVGALGIGYARSEKQRSCQLGVEQIAGVWNEPKKSQIREAFQKTQVPYWQDTWKRVEQNLSNYANEWAASYQNACEATHLKGEQSEHLLDLRMLCLKRRAVGMNALANVLAQADAKIVEKAVQSISQLERLEPCSDTEALLKESESMEAPKDPARVQAVRDKLAQVKALDDAGQYQKGLDMADQVLAETERLEYPPVEAEALYWLGKLKEDSSSFASSRESYLKALKTAIQSKNDQVALKAAIDLLFVSGYSMANKGEADVWSDMAQAMLERLGRDELQQARLLEKMGSINELRANYDQAQEFHKQALEIRKRVLGPEHLSVSDSYNRLGVNESKSGRLVQAQQYFQQAFELREKILGPEHPRVGASLNNLAICLKHQRKYDLALQLDHRALDIYTKTLGSVHRDIAALLTNMGIVLHHLGRYQESIETLERASAIFREVNGSQNPDYAGSLTELGSTYLARGDYSRALTLLERALSINQSTVGADHPLCAEDHLFLGFVYQGLGNFNRARENFQRSLEIHTKVLGADRATTAESMAGMAFLHVAVREPKLAIPLLERAIPILRNSGSETLLMPLSLGRAQFTMARALWAVGDRERARQLAEESRKTYAEAPPQSVIFQLAEIDDWFKKIRRWGKG